MKRETCNRTSRCGIPGDTCGTKLRDKSWLPEGRIEESDDEETVEDCAHAGGSGDGPRGRPGYRTNARRVLRLHQCSEHRACSRARVCSRCEIRCWACTRAHSRAG